MVRRSYFFFKPELKTVVRNIILCAIFIILLIYIHSEYVSWSEVSGNSQYLSFSYILKNILILLSLILLFFSIKKSKLKTDGFDKFRKMKKVRTTSEIKLERNEKD